ncbi:MAG: ABC transporter ATP-binding protein [Verrucomicrobiota bacterium JB022]|nr:ABC transporter ATP-binding protein [Verrucomicrobiota bacterium JB022]
MPDTPPLLHVQDLRVTFRTEDATVLAVDGVSFEVRPGETLGLVGESGSGKSVTAMSMLQLIPKPMGKIEAGQAQFQGQDLLQLRPGVLRKVRGRKIGIIFQEPMTALSPLHTIGRQLIETQRLHRNISKAEAHRVAVEWLGKVGIPEPEQRMDSFPFQLSGGMRQRVMIAMVLMLDPDLIIADEPTTALDVTTQRGIFELILRMKRPDSAMLFITHDMGVIWQLCDRVVVMKKGKLVEQGDVRQIFSAPEHPYTQQLLSAVPRITDASRRDAVPEPAPEPLIRIEHLKTWFPIKRGLLALTKGHVKAVDDVSLDIFPGEILALVGESGSGKSTLARTILGLEKATAGSITFRSKDLTQLGPKEFRPLRSDLQMVFQDPFSSLNPRMTVRDILTEGMKEHGKLEGDRSEVAAQLLREVELEPEHQWRYPHEFSGGQRQRICIARALSLKPKFIVCDEAVSALDVTVQARVIDLLLGLQDRHGLTYLFVSHDLSVVKRIADRTAVMRHGKIVEMGPTSEVIGNPQHAYTQTLLAAVPVPGDEASRESLRAG